MKENPKQRHDFYSPYEDLYYQFSHAKIPIAKRWSCVGGPLDGDFAYLYDPAWGKTGYYQCNPHDGKLYWVNKPWISK